MGSYISQFSGDNGYQLSKKILSKEYGLHMYEDPGIIIRSCAVSNNYVTSHDFIKEELKFQLLKKYDSIQTQKLLLDYDKFIMKSAENNPGYKSVQINNERCEVLYRIEYLDFNIDKDYILSFRQSE